MTRVTNLQITDVALGGKGVGRVNGKAAFVPFVIDSETVCARITCEHKRFIEAELERVEKVSPHRVGPRCPYFGRCGGCVYQHIDYEHQLTIKSRQVEQTLARLGGISNPPMRPIIPAPLEYGYRNRITVHVLDGVVGFFRRESNTLLDIEHCPISSDAVNARLTQLRAQHPRDGHYSLRDGDGARIFTQANDAVAQAMLELVERLLETSTGTLIDAYCGAGFFTKRLRTRFDNIVGIDWDRHAIAAAQREANAKEQYVAGDVEIELSRRLQSSRCDALIVDPPAAGLSSGVRAAITQLPPARLIYVSCNPATLARDLRDLRQAFTVDSITPLDMFPQTAEIEVVAELSAARSRSPQNALASGARGSGES
jgi:23S rRNA (uracil1939-C5)-methyltransferase